MNGLTAAKGLRRSVEQAGGIMRISVPALGDAFGRGRLTPRARTGIEGVLTRAGLQAVPRLADAGDGWVTLRVAASAPPLGSPGPTVLHAMADEVRALPRPRVPASLAAALTLTVPLIVASAFVLPSGAEEPKPAAGEGDAQTQLLDRANTALLAGDYRNALKLTGRADASRVPRLRSEVVAALLSQARTAQGNGAYVRAIRLSRRAARFGRAPGAQQVVRQSRAGLDLRRANQRRGAR